MLKEFPRDCGKLEEDRWKVPCRSGRRGAMSIFACSEQLPTQFGADSRTSGRCNRVEMDAFASCNNLAIQNVWVLCQDPWFRPYSSCFQFKVYNLDPGMGIPVIFREQPGAPPKWRHKAATGLDEIERMISGALLSNTVVDHIHGLRLQNIIVVLLMVVLTKQKGLTKVNRS